jgi:hypothetical protein
VLALVLVLALALVVVMVLVLMLMLMLMLVLLQATYLSRLHRCSGKHPGGILGILPSWLRLSRHCRLCVCVCVCVCVYACARACVCVCVRALLSVRRARQETTRRDRSIQDATVGWIETAHGRYDTTHLVESKAHTLDANTICSEHITRLDVDNVTNDELLGLDVSAVLRAVTEHRHNLRVAQHHRVKGVRYLSEHTLQAANES